MVTQRAMASLAGILILLSTSSAVQAQGQPSAPAGSLRLQLRAVLKTADGHRVGNIDAIDTDQQGAQTAAQVIFDSRIIHIPASTITAIDSDHFTTSLTIKDLRQL